MKQNSSVTYHITGIDTRGKRFKIVTDNPIHAQGINLFNGTKWIVFTDGRREIIQRVIN